MPNWKKLIVSGSDASLSSLYIDGNLTASAAYLTSASIGHLETIYETASVIYSSGSTKFGDTSDDTHEFTGSIYLSGSLAELIYLDEANGRVGIKTATPQYPFHYVQDTGNALAVYEKQGGAAVFYEAQDTRAALGTVASHPLLFAINSSEVARINTSGVYEGDISGSLTGTASLATTASHTAGTSSIANTAVTSSHTAGTASIANTAVTASYINHLEQDVSITGSVDVSGSVTAHSFNISSQAAGTPTIYSDSNINLSASNAVVVTSSPLRLASFTNAQTGSITAQIGDIIYNSDTADYKLYSGSWLTILNETSTASLATTASHALNVPDTASHALTAVTSSHTAGTASIANTATTSSYTLTGDGIFSGSFSGSFFGDGDGINVNPFPFTGSGEMQGKLTIESFQDYVDEDYVESYFAGTAIASSGDIALTGSIFSPYINAGSFTGSFLNDTGYIVLTRVSESLNFANDSAAQAGGVPLGGLYRNGNAIQIRIT